MLHYEFGNIIFRCDNAGCRAKLETSTSNFESARNLLRRAGWQPLAAGGVIGGGPETTKWIHRCKHCQRASELPLAHSKTRSQHAGSSG